MWLAVDLERRSYVAIKALPLQDNDTELQQKLFGCPATMKVIKDKSSSDNWQEKVDKYETKFPALKKDWRGVTSSEKAHCA